MKGSSLQVLAGLGAAIAIGLLAMIDSVQSEVVLLMAPFGATAVLVFGVPDSPLAQPKNVILGHFITVIIGVLFVMFLPVSPWSLGLATGLAVTVMLVTKTTHPPAGANPILIMLAGKGMMFLVFPVLLGAVIIVMIGQVVNNARLNLLKGNE